MKNDANDCAAVRGQFALMLYGELSFDEEEQVESHLDGCAECREALQRQKALHEAMDGVAITPSPALLSHCREEFSALLDREQRASLVGAGTRVATGTSAWWRRLWVPVSGDWKITFLRPVGAIALLVVGFLAAKVTPELNLGGAYQGMDLANFGGAQVRNVAAQPDGSVRIVLDETRQRMVAGNLDDQNVRLLLLQAAKNATDPNLRARTVTILTGNAEANDVRQALEFALAHDQNPEVRLKAMEGLQQFAGDPAVQSALARALVTDSNAEVRTHAIDVLTAQRGQDLDRQTVGVLQEMMDREDDDYVRQQAQRMLRSVKASAEIY